jgi:hypothetical protein
LELVAVLGAAGFAADRRVGAAPLEAWREDHRLSR